MKTKKILAITLSCLLLIGAMVGFTVAADDAAPSIEIEKVNISHTGAIRILYALNVSNVPEGGAAKMVFSDTEITAPTGKLDDFGYTVNSIAGNVDIGGTAYPAVYSEGFAPADMKKTVYAMPVIVNAEGIVVATGAALEYSIYDCIMDSIAAGTYDADQYALYVATLDFGGAVQHAVNKGVAPEGGYADYADAYYILKTIGGDGAVKTEAYREPIEVDLVAPKGNAEGKLFEKFVDKNGVVYADADFRNLTINLDKIGTTYVEYIYGDTVLNVNGVTGIAGTPAELANAVTGTVIKGGTEYYLDAEITLAAGAAAALDFMVDDTAMLGRVNFTEADGVITVTDDISTFTMANGANLRIEYTVVSTANSTGAIFYYVDGAYVAHSSITTDIATAAGLTNAAFAKVVASATAGEIAVKNAIVGANDGVVEFGSGASSVIYDWDADYGKYFKYSKTEKDDSNCYLKFDIAGEINNAGTTVLEAKVRTSGFASAQWRNYIDLAAVSGPYPEKPGGYSIGGVNGQRLAFVPTGIVWCGIGNATVTHSFGTTSIADNAWFDLKIEHIGSKEFNIYVNGVKAYTATNGTSAMDVFKMTLGNVGGNIQMAELKYYNK